MAVLAPNIKYINDIFYLQAHGLYRNTRYISNNNDVFFQTIILNYIRIVLLSYLGVNLISTQQVFLIESVRAYRPNALSNEFSPT